MPDPWDQSACADHRGWFLNCVGHAECEFAIPVGYEYDVVVVSAREEVIVAANAASEKIEIVHLTRTRIITENEIANGNDFETEQNR